MSTIEEKASMTDTIAIEKNGEAVNPQEQEQKQTFTFVDNDKGEQKEWAVEHLSADAVLVINHLRNLQSDMTALQLKFGDVQAAIESNRKRLIDLLPDDELASITNFDTGDATEH
tara:strand:- start:396 stop:740 length:345 start_codon:yes stop_codon:yes gene_type:complete